MKYTSNNIYDYFKLRYSDYAQSVFEFEYSSPIFEPNTLLCLSYFSGLEFDQNHLEYVDESPIENYQLSINALNNSDFDINKLKNPNKVNKFRIFTPTHGYVKRGSTRFNFIHNYNDMKNLYIFESLGR